MPLPELTNSNTLNGAPRSLIEIIYASNEGIIYLSVRIDEFYKFDSINSLLALCEA